MFVKDRDYVDPRCDVAVIGAGPVGAHVAEMVKAAAPELSVKVFDKRPVATRDHSLRIGKDSIDAVRRFYAKYTGMVGSNGAALAALDATAAQWRARPVRTSTIETAMADHGVRWGVSTHRDKRCSVGPENLSHWLNLTQAHVVIGADGAKSAVRSAIGAQRCEELALGHLLEFKFSVPPHLDPRTRLASSSQAVRAEGWDFETAGRADLSRHERRFTLHKFIDRHTHTSMLETRPDGAVQGTSETPWTVSDLGELALRSPRTRWVDEHIRAYLDDHELMPGQYWNDRVLTLPLTVYRSTRSAKNVGGQVVALAGDSNAGLVLERGANKGLIEAALCADATVSYARTRSSRQPSRSARMRYLHQPSRALLALDLVGMPQASRRATGPAFLDASLADPVPALPAEFAEYEASTRALFAHEKTKAWRKAKLLQVSEGVLRLIARPVNWLVSQLTS